MHEAALGEAILTAVLERAGGRTVSRIRLRVGAVHRVSAAALERALAEAAGGTAAAAAAVDIVSIPALLSCAACGAVNAVDDPWAVCPSCGSADVIAGGGDELAVDAIELSDES